MESNPYLGAGNKIVEFPMDFGEHDSNPFERMSLKQLKQLGERYGATDLDQVTDKSTMLELAWFVDACYRREHPHLDWNAADLNRIASDRLARRGDGQARKAAEAAVAAALNLSTQSTSKTRTISTSSDSSTSASKLSEGFPHFMALPPEIRERVYLFAFEQLHPISRLSSAYRGDGAHNLTPTYGVGDGALGEHALTRTSRRLRAESLTLFYRTRRFPLATQRAQMRWLHEGLLAADNGDGGGGGDGGKLALLRRFSVRVPEMWTLNIDVDVHGGTAGEETCGYRTWFTDRFSVLPGDGPQAARTRPWTERAVARIGRLRCPRAGVGVEQIKELQECIGDLGWDM
ncbi:hypothetical protein MBLNU459_g2511t1 [Dothideomycetes sp. NU459]